MDRPSTSKARGICKYYQTSRGCFAGNTCKFLHGDPKVDIGENARLTPYDQAKTCRYFAKGYCKHGTKCWFLHVSPEPTVKDVEIDPTDELCSICFEKPALYGLLSGCSHIFCISCLKEWRDPKAKSSDVVTSGVHKKCPMCRAPSKFVTPSSIFYKTGDLRKDHTISAYKESMARVDCRYFVQSQARDKNKPFCPFGKDCFYRHANGDGTLYVFADGVDESMRKAAQQRERREQREADDLMNDLFGGVDTSLNNPLGILRRFIRESQLTNAVTGLFQGVLLDAAGREWEPNTLSIDLGPGRLNEDLPPLERIPGTQRPRQPGGQPGTNVPRSPTSNNNSVNRATGNDDDGNDTDNSMPPLRDVSDSDDSSLAWSDGDSNSEGEDEDEAPSSRFVSPTTIDAIAGSQNVSSSSNAPPPPAPTSASLTASPSTPAPPTSPPSARTGRFPRIVWETNRGFRFQETSSASMPSNNSNSNSNPFASPTESDSSSHDVHTIQSFAHQLAARRRAEEADDSLGELSGSRSDVPEEESMPSLEDLACSDKHHDGDEDSQASEDDLPTLTEPSEDTSEGEDAEEQQHEVNPPPFTTDGRGRVIAASNDTNEDNVPGTTRQAGRRGDGRSFLSRMFDVLF